MKMLPLFAAATGLFLLGASPPPMDTLDGPVGASGGYPPCSRSLHDRCIQLYERGVASRRNLAMNARYGPGRMAPRYAYGPMGPRYGEMRERRVVVMAGNDYPPCGRGLADRCIQAPSASGGPAPRRIAYRAHYEREVVRIGERG